MAETTCRCALLPLWSTWLSYAISYLFIAIVRINHHYLLSYAKTASQRLVWTNFAHMFTVSLIPLSTEWVADSGLASAAVMFYAIVFVFVNITDLALCWEAVDLSANEGVPEAMSR